MKRIVLILAVAAAVVCEFSINVFAERVEKVYLNDNEMRFEENDDGTLMFPMRDLFETAGFTVQWFGESNRVIAFNDNLSITIINGTNTIYINRIAYTVSDTLGIRSGEFLVNEEVACLALGAEINRYEGMVYITSSIADETSEWQYEVFDRLNEIRVENGLDEFIWNVDLAVLAEEYGNDMVNRGYFSHDNPEGVDPFERMRRSGITFHIAAENLAAGQPSPEKVVEAWMNSEGHRENILNPNLKECGIAVVRGGRYGIYWVNEFIAY